MSIGAYPLLSPADLDRPRHAPAKLPPGRHLGRVVNFEKAAARYGSVLTSALANGYASGDELAYDLMCDFRDLPGMNWKVFHRRVEGRPAEQDPDPTSQRDFFATLENAPDWVDWRQLERGATAYWQPGAMVPVMLVGAIGGGFKSYGGMKPLVISGRLLDPDKVGKRMTETLRYATAVTTPGGMRPGQPGWTYTAHVRMVHASVRWSCTRLETWDWADWGLPANSTDNLTVSLEFSVGLLDSLAKAGVRLSRRQREDIVALWRYIAYALGTPEALLPANEEEARHQLAVINMLDHEPDIDNRQLLHSLVEFSAANGLCGYDPLPPWISSRLTPERRKAFTLGLMRYCAGARVSNQMHIPATAHRHLLPSIAPLFLATSLARRRPGHDDAQRCAQVLDSLRSITKVRAGDAALVDGEQVADDIRARALART